MRETSDEVGLTVTALKLLGERVQSNTGRRMAYVACSIQSGEAHVAYDDGLADIVRIQPAEERSAWLLARCRRDTRSQSASLCNRMREYTLVR